MSTYDLVIGDIGIAQGWVITPNGRAPLTGSLWFISNQTTVRRTIPTVAIVLAIIFAVFCLLGLLFLLMKEEEIVGYVQVTVQSAGLTHTVQIPVSTSQEIAHLQMLVAQAQGMSGGSSTTY